MSDPRLTPRYLPGEEAAIHEVLAHGHTYGFGNLLSHLKAEWSRMMQERYGFDRDTADRAGRFICAWCDVDERTGKKVKPKVKR
jgi:hypothetical protein